MIEKNPSENGLVFELSEIRLNALRDRGAFNFGAEWDERANCDF